MIAILATSCILPNPNSTPKTNQFVIPEFKVLTNFLKTMSLKINVYMI